MIHCIPIIIVAGLFLSLLLWPTCLEAFLVNVGPSPKKQHWPTTTTTTTTATTRQRPFSVAAVSATSSDDNDDNQSDPATLPAVVDHHHVVFEYCTGCRWMTRAFWMAQELLTTFNDDTLSAVTVVPSRPSSSDDGGVGGAKFVVSHYCCQYHNNNNEDETTTTTILWDRASKQGFPEIKELKQLVRDKISPNLFLGHSDNKERDDHNQQDDDTATAKSEEDESSSSAKVLLQVLRQQTAGTEAEGGLAAKQPNVAIQYCTGCRWMLRSAYFGTELMTTFCDEINSFTLIPSRPPEKGGVFTVTVNGDVVWDRAERGGFPEVKELKHIIRDVLAPSRDLGHSDTKERASRKQSSTSGDENEADGFDDDDEMDDDEAAEMRAYYGVM